MSNLIYGHHPVVEAINAGKPVEKVLFQQGLRGDLEKEIRHLTKAHDIPLQVVPIEKLNKLVRGNHQGVIAWTSIIEYLTLEDVLPAILERGETPLILLLDGITDVRNFGAICRSATCASVPFRASGVISPTRCWRGCANIRVASADVAAAAVI